MAQLSVTYVTVTTDCMLPCLLLHCGFLPSWENEFKPVVHRLQLFASAATVKPYPQPMWETCVIIDTTEQESDYILIFNIYFYLLAGEKLQL